MLQIQFLRQNGVVTYVTDHYRLIFQVLYAVIEPFVALI